jgi:aspartate dehydrogenase
MDNKRLAVIGHGAIARDVMEEISARFTGYSLAVLHRSEQSDRVLDGIKHVATLDEVLAWKPDLVIEAAGHDAVLAYVPLCLARGVPVLLSSVGALHEDALFEHLIAQAVRGQTRLVLPSGAIGGLDYVRASQWTEQTVITYESRKPLKAWQDELQARGYDLAGIDQPVLLFEGSAREAARLYPSNLNVAATLALAGIGMDNTQVRVMADPFISGNQHHIHVQSDHGTMSVQFANEPSRLNPKSSRIVAKSIVAAVQQYFSPTQFL